MAVTFDVPVLVIDDQIGTPGCDRDAFLDAVSGEFPLGEATSTGVVFHFASGLGPDGRPSLEAVVDAIRAGWPFAHGGRWALILLDVRFGREEEFGFDALTQVRERRDLGSDLPIVMLTSEDAAKRNRAGELRADGFLPKLDAEGRPVLSAATVRDRLLRCGLQEDDRGDGVRLIGRSLPFLKMLREARRAALFGQERLLYGETGVGKTVLAAYIHHHSGRSGRFEHIYADSVNPEQIKIQLFGAWKGSWTGQLDLSVPGHIEQAHGGTFFLDEVANLSTELQESLLQFRQKDVEERRRIRRHGIFPAGTKHEPEARKSVVPSRENLLPDGTILVDVLFFTGTNVDLQDKEKRAASGFREDLLHALGTRLYCPNLNERREDVREIFREVLRRKVRALRSGAGPPDIETDESVYQLLESRDWSTHGNLRDVDRIAAYAASSLIDFDRLYLHHLPEDVLGGSKVAPPSTIGENGALPPDRPGREWAIAEVRSLRRQAELLERAAQDSRTTNHASGEPEDYQPSVAIHRLTGVKITPLNAKRLIKEILGSILEPTQLRQQLLDGAGLGDAQAWVRSRPLLLALYDYARGDISAEAISERAQSLTRTAGR